MTRPSEGGNIEKKRHGNVQPGAPEEGVFSFRLRSITGINERFQVPYQKLQILLRTRNVMAVLVGFLENVRLGKGKGFKGV